jgi:hypothetical protein
MKRIETVVDIVYDIELMRKWVSDSFMRCQDTEDLLDHLKMFGERLEIIVEREASTDRSEFEPIYRRPRSDSMIAAC